MSTVTASAGSEEIRDTLGGKQLPDIVECEPADVLKQRDVSHFVAGHDVLEHDRVEHRREILVAAVLVVAELLDRGQPARPQIRREQVPRPGRLLSLELQELRQAQGKIGISTYRPESSVARSEDSIRAFDPVT